MGKTSHPNTEITLTEIYNKMTPFFNVFLDDKFQSCHYGTELYL